jgi:hypothetical protein
MVIATNTIRRLTDNAENEITPVISGCAIPIGLAQPPSIDSWMLRQTIRTIGLRRIYRRSLRCTIPVTWANSGTFNRDPNHQ